MEPGAAEQLKDPVKIVEHIRNIYKSNHFMEDYFHIRIDEIRCGEVTVSLDTVPEKHTNHRGVLHGGTSVSYTHLPYGFILHEGKYILGDQVDDKERVDFIGMTTSGNLIAGNYNKKELRDLGAVEGLTFGPPLIMNGKKVIRSGDGGWGISPRSCIGQKKDGTIMFLSLIHI